jgi:hypothetical protein
MFRSTKCIKYIILSFDIQKQHKLIKKMLYHNDDYIIDNNMIYVYKKNNKIYKCIVSKSKINTISDIKYCILLINLGNVLWRTNLLTQLTNIKNIKYIVIGYNRLLCSDSNSMICHFIRRYCTLKYIEILNTNVADAVNKLYMLMK